MTTSIILKHLAGAAAGAALAVSAFAACARPESEAGRKHSCAEQVKIYREKTSMYQRQFEQAVSAAGSSRQLYKQIFEGTYFLVNMIRDVNRLGAIRHCDIKQAAPEIDQLHMAIERAAVILKATPI